MGRTTVAAVVEACERRTLFAALDPAWGVDGIQHEPYPVQSGSGLRYSADATAVLGDGKVLVLAKQTDLSGNTDDFNWSLVRFDSDGSVDTTFGGGDGTLPLADMAWGMAVAADGTVYLSKTDRGAGGGFSTGNARYVEARNPDGSLKTSFDGDGRYDFTYIGSADVLHIAVAPDGDLYAAATTAGEQATVVKLNPDGTGDPAFNDDGILTYAPGAENGIDEVVVQPSGHFVTLSTSGFGFTRVSPTGAVQQTGRVFDGIYPNRMAIQDDGKIVVVDDVSINLNPYYLRLGRLNADLTLDTTYGDNGVARSPDLNNGTSKEIDGIVIDNEGRAVVPIALVDVRTILMRFTPDGDFDTSLSPDVGLSLDINGARSIAVQDDGNYVVGSYPFAVSRVTSETQDVALGGGLLAVRGTSGADNITISLSGANVVLNRNGTQTTYAAADVDRFSVDGLEGNDTITVTADLPATVNGRGGNDTITTAGGADRIFGGDGADVIDSGDGGGESVEGGAGNDRITCGDAGFFNGSFLAHTVNGGDGNDTITTGPGQDSIHGDGGDDSITVGDKFDEIWGDDGDNVIRAADDGAYIQVEGGDDTIVTGNASGNEGVDYDIPAAGGNDSITGGDGIETISLSGGNVTISTAGGDDQIFGGTDPDSVIDTGAGNDIVAIAEAKTVDAGDGNDQVTVEGALTISGGAGDDFVTARRSVGQVHGGDGNDTVRANSDADHPAVLFGDAGDDNLFTGDGRDSVYGGAGRDTVHAGNGPDLLSGGGGHDKLFGQGGNDRIYGGAGDDRLDGQGGGDRLVGAAGSDRINGGASTLDSADLDDDEDELLHVELDLV
jgi:uncharacterized delta-60 repeat protein